MGCPTHPTQSSSESLAPNNRNQSSTPRPAPPVRKAGANNSADRTTPIRHGPCACQTTNPTSLRSPIPALLPHVCRSIPPNQSTLTPSQLRKPNNPHSARVSRRNSSHVQQCITPSPHHARRDLQSIEVGRLPVPPIDECGMARMDLLPRAFMRADCSGLTGGRSHDRGG